MTEQVNNSANNKRLAKNTIALYFRMVLLMCINLYASRVVLSTLGISDYGLYNVVGGVVIMFGFLNATLSTSTQRFLNIEIGKGVKERVKKVFSSALLLHLILVCVVVFLAETIGLWFVVEKLNVPDDRESAVLWVYQFSIAAVCVQIIQLPFMSTLIAHERMGIYAYISIIEAILKMGVVLCLPYISFDKLVLYAGLILGVQISIALIYNIYSQYSFPEARFKVCYDKDLFHEMLGFSGWNVVGSLASVCNNHGLNIVLNLFFGTVINAARGVAFQVYGLVFQFVSNFQIAVKPQVIKYYAAGQIADMEKLVFRAARYSAFLVMIIVVPLIVEIRPLLHLWLGTYPDYTPIFVSIILLQSIITSITGNIVMVVHASGYLKNVGIYGGLTLLMALPISYILLKLGCPPMIPFIINMCAALGEAFFELYWMKRYINFPMGRFYKEVYGVVSILTLISFVFTITLHKLIIGICGEYPTMIIVGFISFSVSAMLIYRFGLDEASKKMIKAKILKKK